MTWKKTDALSERLEFVVLASNAGANIRELCRRFGVSPTSAYKVLKRFRAEGNAGLADRSRRPLNSPSRTLQPVEAVVAELRQAHPTWGGRKIRWKLEQAAVTPLPAASTVTNILRRQGFIAPAESAKHQAFVRFEHPAPNLLWQVDFKGHFQMQFGRCHPLTIMDDHSRFNIALEACADEKTETVQACLTSVFRRYGLPRRILSDNGAPWGTAGGPGRYTQLSVWLMRLGVGASHGAPYHPQTQGKDERFHRTFKADVLNGRTFTDLAECQLVFDTWRAVYNCERPHEGIGMVTPASRYQPSQRDFPETLPEIEYAPGDQIRKVQQDGDISFQGRVIQVGKAFRGQPVAVRATDQEHILTVHFCGEHITSIDLKTTPKS